MSVSQQFHHRKKFKFRSNYKVRYLKIGGLSMKFYTIGFGFSILYNEIDEHEN